MVRVIIPKGFHGNYTVIAHVDGKALRPKVVYLALGQAAQLAHIVAI